MNACPRQGYLDLPVAEGGERSSPATAVERAVERMSAVRDAVGSGVGIGLDFHGRCKLPTARRMMRALEPFEPLFYEEPVAGGLAADGGGVEALRALAAATPIPLAAGERSYTRGEFRDLLESRALGVLQPDCSHAGDVLRTTFTDTQPDFFLVCAAFVPLVLLCVCERVRACPPVSFICASVLTQNVRQQISLPMRKPPTSDVACAYTYTYPLPGCFSMSHS
jgi:galactonate dehydratase